MAHFAQLDGDNKVINVIVVDNDVITVDGEEVEQVGIDFCKSLLGEDTVWKQCSYNNNFRHVYPSELNSTYDEDNDVFILPQPYPSWTLDSNFNWLAPVPYPDAINDKKYIWDEELHNSDNALGWIEYTG
tara:strand:- start:850 stop:1239 length:390 start_codon:yes stop_codon:yes gene_type:complete